MVRMSEYCGALLLLGRGGIHDHEIEIASGRVQVLDVSAEEAKAIAKVTAGTDGIISNSGRKGRRSPMAR